MRQVVRDLLLRLKGLQERAVQRDPIKVRAVRVVKMQPSYQLLFCGYDHGLGHSDWYVLLQLAALPLHPF